MFYTSWKVKNPCFFKLKNQIKVCYILIFETTGFFFSASSNKSDISCCFFSPFDITCYWQLKCSVFKADNFKHFKIKKPPNQHFWLRESKLQSHVCSLQDVTVFLPMKVTVFCKIFKKIIKWDAFIRFNLFTDEACTVQQQEGGIAFYYLLIRLRQLNLSWRKCLVPDVMGVEQAPMTNVKCCIIAYCTEWYCSQFLEATAQR